MKKGSKIYVAGHNGMVGSALVRGLRRLGFNNLILRSRNELDLLDSKATGKFFQTEKPEYVFMAAAKVGGIFANQTQKADFIYENLQVQNNVIYESWKNDVVKLLFLGSSCIYPKHAKQPIKEEYILTGPLEPTNDAYAIAKIAGIMMCQAFNEQYKTNYVSVMPTNLYGDNDNFDLNTSHVLPALIRKFHNAKVMKSDTVELWGDGSPFREFLHVDDMADACIFLMQKYNGSEIINIGSGQDMPIRELATLISSVVGYKGKITWDISKPNGTPRKLLSVSKLNELGWKYTITLQSGIEKTYKWFLKNYS